VYWVDLVKDKASQAGYRELLTHLNGTLKDNNNALISVPKLIFEYGLHKLVFRVEIKPVNQPPGETRMIYREAFTYFNVVKSPLEPILISGSVTKVARWVKITKYSY